MNRHAAVITASAAALALAACETVPDTAPSPEVTAAHVAFDASVDALTRDYMQMLPETSTVFGVPEEVAGEGFNARLSDFSPAGEARMQAVLADVAAQMREADPDALDDGRRLTRQVLLAQAEASLAAAEAAPYGSSSLGFYMVYPVNQFSSAITDIFQVMQVQQPLSSREDAAAYVARLEAFGPAFDGLIASVEADAEAGSIPPDFVLARSRTIIENFLAPPAGEHSLVTTLAEKLAAADLEGNDLVVDAETAVADIVYPAYQKLDRTLARLETSATHDAGIWRLPEGDALYQRLIRLHGDSDLTADEVHEIGLAEVERIHTEMDAILNAEGITEGGVVERLDALGTDPQFVVTNDDDGRAALIEAANGYIAELDPLLDEWFSTLPPQPVEVRRVPEVIEASQALGYYTPPPLGTDDPGVFWINLRDPALWPTWTVKTTTYHEAAPGHHFQIALSLDQQDLPLVRKIFGVSNTVAFAEGWALYSEQLTQEMGLYDDDPLGDLGRLKAELFRAVRLVVDTGLHAKRWSREEAIAYMVEAGAVSGEDEAVAEVERYVVLPGQALGYKLGMLKILELRAEAEEALGEDFDIRDFHDAVLGDGGVPMAILEERVAEWVAGE